MPKKEDTSAIYQVQRFLFSEQAKQFNLNSYDVAILFVIASHLDMPEGKCFGKQTTLAERTFMCRREFQNRSLRLHQLGLILRYQKRKLYHYELGSQITGVLDEDLGAQYALMSSENDEKNIHKRTICA